MAVQGVGAGTGAGAAGTAGAVGAGVAEGTVIEGTVDDITTGMSVAAFTVNIPERPSISTL